MNAMNALSDALKRLETVGNAGQTAKPSNAVENRVKIIDPVRDDWKSLKLPLDYYELKVGVNYAGGAFTGQQADWTNIANSLAAR